MLDLLINHTRKAVLSTILVRKFMIQKEYAFDKNEFNEEVPIHQLLDIDLAFLKDDSYSTYHLNTKNKKVIDRLFLYGSTWHNYGDILYKTINLFLEELHELSEQPFNHYNLYQLIIQTIKTYLNYLLANDPKRLESFLDPTILNPNTNFLSYLEIRQCLLFSGRKEDFYQKYPSLRNLSKEYHPKFKSLIGINASITFEEKLLLLLDDSLSQEQKNIVHRELVQLANNNSILGRTIIIDPKYFTKDIDQRIRLEQYLNHILLNDNHIKFLKFLVNEFQNSTDKENSKLLNERIVIFLNLCFQSNNSIIWEIENLDLRNLDLSNLKNFNKLSLKNPIFNEKTIIDPRNPDIMLRHLNFINPKFQVNEKTTLEEIKHESEKHGQTTSLNQYLQENDNNVYIDASDFHYCILEDAKNFPYNKENTPEYRISPQLIFYKNLLEQSIGGESFLKLLYLSSYRDAPDTSDDIHEFQDYGMQKDDIAIINNSYLFTMFETKESVDQILIDTFTERRNLKIENDQLKQQIEELTVQNQQLSEALQIAGPKGIKINENHPEPLGVHTKSLKSLKDSSDISKGSLKWL